MPDKVFDLLIVLAVMFSALAMVWVIMRQIRLVRRESTDTTRLETENSALKREMAKLTDRVAVLERIATDPAARTALEIESLRTLARPPEREDR